MSNISIFKTKSIFTIADIALGCKNACGCLEINRRTEEHRSNCDEAKKKSCLLYTSNYVSYKHLKSGVPVKVAKARLETLDEDLLADISEGLVDPASGSLIGGVVFLCGPVGVGKSWAASAVVADVYQNHDKGTARWVDAMTVEALFRQLWSDRKPAEQYDPFKDFIQDAKKVKLLVLDGMQDARMTVAVLSEILNLIRFRMEKGIPTIITSNLQNVSEFGTMIEQAQVKNSDAFVDRIIENFTQIIMEGESRRVPLAIQRRDQEEAEIAPWLLEKFNIEKLNDHSLTKDDDGSIIMTDVREDLERIYSGVTEKEDTPEEWEALRLRLKKKRDRADERDLMFQGMLRHKWMRPKLEYITNNVQKPGVYVRRVREHMEDIADDPNFLKNLWLETRFIAEDDFDRYKIYKKLKKEVKKNQNIAPDFDIITEFKKRCREKSKKKEEIRADLILMRDEMLASRLKRCTEIIEWKEDLIKKLEEPFSIEDSLARADKLLHQMRSYEELTEAEREGIDKERLANKNRKHKKARK